MTEITTESGDPPIADENVEQSRRDLRRRWELASVLNFFRVFKPVVGNEMKISSDDIETALITANDTLAKLHINLLKGIPPVNKNLSDPDAWVTILCKKLAEWWPWVAEGKIPLTAGKGEEISRYKELDPVIRLSMLKALCELRTEQDDLMSYINDALKEGKDVSHFQVYKITENGTGMSFWYDGDAVMGYRLYREVNKPQPKSRSRGKGKGHIDLPPTNSEWETLATNLDEFLKFSENLSSSSDVVEGAVYQTIETEVIPALEKLKKKKERDLKRRQREAALIDYYHSDVARRTCRTRKPVMYTFDEYDRTIEEAIKVTGEGKSRKVEKNGTKRREDGKRGRHASNGDLTNDDDMEETSQDSTDEGEGNDGIQVVEDSEDNDDNTEYVHSTNKTDDTKGTSNSQGENGHVSDVLIVKDSSDSSSDHSRKPSNPRAKNRLRQRPTHNSALESSDHGNTSDNATLDISGEGSPSEVADSEDDISN